MQTVKPHFLSGAQRLALALLTGVTLTTAPAQAQIAKLNTIHREIAPREQPHLVRAPAAYFE
jgi:hypothetical protein